MSRGRGIVYTILIFIPVLAILVLLAMVNVLYMLLGVVVVLGVLVILKRRDPQMFAWMHRRKEKADGSERQQQRVRSDTPPVKVYMILTGQGAQGDLRITVDKPLFHIGRDERNDFILSDRRIGRQHILIEYSPEEDICYAVDLGSVNGSYLNSQRMAEGMRYRLVQGDCIKINDRPFAVEYAHY